MPLLHGPTWTPEGKPPVLVMAMRAAGALYVRTERAAVFILETLRQARGILPTEFVGIFHFRRCPLLIRLLFRLKTFPTPLTVCISSSRPSSYKPSDSSTNRRRYARRTVYSTACLSRCAPTSATLLNVAHAADAMRCCVPRSDGSATWSDCRECGVGNSTVNRCRVGRSGMAGLGGS